MRKVQKTITSNERTTGRKRTFVDEYEIGESLEELAGQFGREALTKFVVERVEQARNRTVKSRQIDGWTDAAHSIMCPVDSRTSRSRAHSARQRMRLLPA